MQRFYAQTVMIVTAYLKHNQLKADELPGLVLGVGTAFANIAGKPSDSVVCAELKNTMRGSNLVCLECGQSVALLGVHLRNHHNMKPDAYRAKHGLPKDYPMVSPAASKAKSIASGKRWHKQG
tara:strand:+ start:15004 stop:15372 length:369 start_codon:yes stop_codon:yes gene_type:complete